MHQVIVTVTYKNPRHYDMRTSETTLAGEYSRLDLAQSMMAHEARHLTAEVLSATPNRIETRSANQSVRSAWSKVWTIN